MPLVTCPDCNNQISDAAPVCHHCGRPLGVPKSSVPFGTAKSRKQGCLAAIGISVALVAFMVWLLGGKADRARNAPALTYTTVELGVLLREYESNEVRADAAYKGRLIRVEGIATGVSKGLTGGVFMTLGTTGEVLEIPSVQCFIEPSSVSSFMNVSKGSRVAVQGRVDGLLMNVLIKDCELAN